MYLRVYLQQNLPQKAHMTHTPSTFQNHIFPCLKNVAPIIRYI